ncbi:NAD-dependent epimerase/dehydratase family protein [Vibrio sp. CDRSL-10 TSBA]
MNVNKLGVTLLGATGFLGSAIAEELERSGINWIGVTVDSCDHPKIRSIAVENFDEVIEIINDYPIVINAAGALKPNDFENDLGIAAKKFWGTVEQFTSAFKSSKIDTLVHLSSAGTVYGELEQYSDPHREQSLLQPISWYGRMKVFEELHYEKISNALGTKFICARVSNPYGNKKKTKHGFIDVLINCIKEGKELYLYNDCDPIRDFIYAQDMSRMIVNMIITRKSGVYNVASGQSNSLSEIIDYVKAKNFPIKINKINSKPQHDVVSNVLDVSKAIDEDIYTNTMTVYDYIDIRLQDFNKKSA